MSWRNAVYFPPVLTREGCGCGRGRSDSAPGVDSERASRRSSSQCSGSCARPRPAARLPPDRQHALGRGRREFVVKAGEIVDPLDRLADRRIEEQQDALEHGGRHAERPGGDHDRLAGRIARDALGQRSADAERAFEHAGKFAGVALQGGVFQAADHFARCRCRARALCRPRRRDWSGSGGARRCSAAKNTSDKVGPDGRLRRGPRGCRRDRARRGNAELAKDRRRRGRVGRQLARDDGERRRIDGVDQPAREFDDIGFLPRRYGPASARRGR